MRPYSTVATKRPLNREIRGAATRDITPLFSLNFPLSCSHNEWNKVSIQWAVSAAVRDSKKNSVQKSILSPNNTGHTAISCT